MLTTLRTRLHELPQLRCYIQVYLFKMAIWKPRALSHAKYRMRDCREDGSFLTLFRIGLRA